ncbi:MAG: WYL domain-containing protein [Bacteroidetes bacterium]|nr:WYL domain-containing protein [Bacteroidota bacterium]
MNFQRRMDAFDMFNSLNLAQNLNQYIHLERRRPQGTEHIYGILHAIKNKVQVAFSYQKFWEAETTQRILEPYGLKEFRQRWYVMGKEKKNGEVRTFGLDRITNLDVTNRKFEFPANFNIEEYFKYSFGIIGPNGKKPEEIILSFDAVQGKYIKTLPLHVDQEILFENKDELRLKLFLFITDDLIMELLSFGENMMVIKPKSLAKLMKDEHKKAYQQY